MKAFLQSKSFLGNEIGKGSNVLCGLGDKFCIKHKGIRCGSEIAWKLHADAEANPINIRREFS